MWLALSVVRATHNPPGSYWVIVNRVMQASLSCSCSIPDPFANTRCSIGFVCCWVYRASREVLLALCCHQLPPEGTRRPHRREPAWSPCSRPFVQRQPAPKKTPHATKKGHRSSLSADALSGINGEKGSSSGFSTPDEKRSKRAKKQRKEHRCRSHRRPTKRCLYASHSRSVR